MRAFLLPFLLCTQVFVFAQDIVCDNAAVTDAYRLAINTIHINVRRGVLAAGADYGGDWTRDIAINSWNAVSLLMPAVAERSLWHVTPSRDTIGDQYWDKMIWSIAAANHYRVTDNKDFLQQAYRCAAATMTLMEGRQFDVRYGLFMGPSVFNDGIAGYPAPIYDSSNTHSGAMENANTLTIKCLSTNCIYYGAYLSLIEMGTQLGNGGGVIDGYRRKAAALEAAILKNYYIPTENRFNYLIDHHGRIDPSQEALGLSFAVIFGILDKDQAYRAIHQAHAGKFGVSSIYPDFARYTAGHPGRHNNLIWPMVNGFFAQAAVIAGDRISFLREFNGLTQLALDPDKGDYDFREIYHPLSGQPDGGWQANGPEHPDFHWASCKLQTWSATAYCNMVLYGLAGLRVGNEGVSFQPFLPESIHELTLSGIRYRTAILNVTVRGKGNTIRSFAVNGKKQTVYSIPATLKGVNSIVVELE